MSINSDKRIGKLVPDNFKRENAAGVRFDSGPYIGKVKNNLDPTRSGRLQVWIADFGSGKEDDPNNWRTVSYATPYAGFTTQNENDKENTFSRVRHSYGMWFTPPDVDNLVLCVFVAGDPMRGYWFACVPNQLGHYMTPAIGSSDDIEISKIEDAKLKAIVKSGPLPVVEWNENNPDSDWTNFTKNKKPLHEPQVKILVEQGLDRFKLTGSRGIIKSNSQRETPSQVFGVSTPGRSAKGNPSPTATDQERRVTTRLGGHTFVMDDGDQEGKDNLVRLRSSSGHQILLDDSQGLIYVSNALGTTWIELTASGHVNVFADQGINLRTKGDFNLHADKDININAGGSLRITGKKETYINSDQTLTVNSTGKITVFGNSIGMGSDGRIDISTASSGSFTATGPLLFTGKPVGLNSGVGPTVNKPKPITACNLPDTEKDGNGQWQVIENKICSIAKICPTHEPWPRKAGVVNSTLSGSGSVGGTGGSSILSQPSTTTTQPSIASGPNQGLSSASGSALSKGAPKELLNRADAPNPPAGIGNLSQTEIKALMTQIAFSESSFDYTVVNSGGYLGKYQFGASALVDNGYIHRAAFQQYGQAALNYPSSWTGKDGVNSKSQFLGSPSAQENAMYSNLQKNYNTLSQYGGIRSGDDNATISGMLMTSHLLGAGGAKTWRETGQGADANNTTGATYFNRGKYANQVLATVSTGPTGG